MKRPNILFVFADDWGRYASIYAGKAGGNALCDLIETPNIDRVAREGALFTHATVPAPTCTPCRSSLLSGRYFWQTGLGAILQGAIWDRAIPSYPMILEASGYHIGFSDKVWAPGTPRNDPYGGDTRRYQNAGAKYDRYSFFLSDWVANGMTLEEGKQVMDQEVRENYRQFRAAQPNGTPFAYWWGPTNTHRPWKRGSGAENWGLHPDDLKGRLPAFLPDVPEIREDVCDYLGECLALDRGVGVLLAELEASGELDSTLVVVSGDHGIPGVPRAKCNLYDLGCEVALMARLPGKIPAGLRIDDMVNIMDLAPTFLEFAGLTPPEGMTARSLMPLLTSTTSGQIDPERTFVITGRERHCATAREWNKPYPQRAIRTHDFLLIHNYAPERWPMGNPCGMDDLTAPALDYETILNTFSCYHDMDGSPTKAWMVHHRAEEKVHPLFELGFGKRPEIELYDLRTDPDMMQNVAEDAVYLNIRMELFQKLKDELIRQQDPREVEADCRFEHAPFTDWPCPDESVPQRLEAVRKLMS